MNKKTIQSISNTLNSDYTQDKNRFQNIYSKECFKEDLLSEKVDNAIIMAAGMSSRFAPISYEIPKGLIKVKGEILIERQIKQLKEAGIEEIIIVVGYKKEMFYYLKEKFGVVIVENPEFNTRNNHSSLYYARGYLKNSYICSADNYFTTNVFNKYEFDSFYSSVFIDGDTDEWCLYFDEDDLIKDVKIGGVCEWIMLGHAYFTREFSNTFIDILVNNYHKEDITSLLWESLYTKNLDKLKMYIKKFSNADIFEFDTLDELRAFDSSYKNDTNSAIIKHVTKILECIENDITECKPIYSKGDVIGFSFLKDKRLYSYMYDGDKLEEEKQNYE